MARQTEGSPQSKDLGYDILPHSESVKRGDAALAALDRNLAAAPDVRESRHPLDIVVGPPEAQALHDLDLEMNPLSRHLDWVTNPDSPYMQERFERDLQRGVDELVRGATKVRSRLKGKIPMRRVAR